MIYLIVGLDRQTVTPWHVNIGARDAKTAKRLARTRACTEGIDLEVAAVIGRTRTSSNPARQALNRIRLVSGAP